jgi:hypothetical protein
MQVIQTLLSLSSVINVHIRHLLEQRFLSMTCREEIDPDFHGNALIIEPCDKLEDLLVDAEGSILKGLVETSPYVIPPESVEEHPAFFDVVFIPSDGDYAITVVIPKIEGIDPELLAICAEIATPAPLEISV